MSHPESEEQVLTRDIRSLGARPRPEPDTVLVFIAKKIDERRVSGRVKGHERQIID